MKIQAPVRQETKKIAIGVLVLSTIMLLVFAAIGRFDISVVWGTLFGSSYAVLNFFLMAMTVQNAAEQMNGVRLPAEEETETENENQEEMSKEELPQQKKARSMIQRSYYLRMAMTAVVAIVAVKAPVFNAVAAIIAQFFPRIIITFYPLIDRFQKGE